MVPAPDQQPVEPPADKAREIDLELRHRAYRVCGVVFPVVRRAAHVFLAESALPTGSTRKGVGIALFFSGSMFNLEIELLDFHHLASLLTEGRRCQTEPTKSAVVGPQEERATEEVDPELPESFHHSQQLLACGAVFHFSSGMSLAEIRYHPFLSALQLRQNSANRQIGCVNIEDKPTVIDGQRQDRSRDQTVAKLQE